MSSTTTSHGPRRVVRNEPNDAAYDRVFFEHYGVNPFVDTEDDRLSTFAMDVDTGSYTVVRRFLRDGYFPEPDAVHVEEMVNFFDYGDEPPKKGEFAIRSELASSPFATTARTRLLRIGVRSRTVEPEERRPVVLTFLVDVSGSMDRGDRLELVKRGLSLLIDGLREDDRVGARRLRLGCKGPSDTDERSGGIDASDQPAHVRGVDQHGAGSRARLPYGRGAFCRGREQPRRAVLGRRGERRSYGVGLAGWNAWRKKLHGGSS